MYHRIPIWCMCTGPATLMVEQVNRTTVKYAGALCRRHTLNLGKFSPFPRFTTSLFVKQILDWCRNPNISLKNGPVGIFLYIKMENIQCNILLLHFKLLLLHFPSELFSFNLTFYILNHLHRFKLTDVCIIDSKCTFYEKLTILR